MADASGSELCLLESCGQEEMLQTTKELERMVEAVENMSVQLSVLAYDMVVLRTDPEQAQAMQRLQEAYQRCEEVVLRPHLDTPYNDTSFAPADNTRDAAASDTSSKSILE